jgi:hypothetical protein
MVCRRRLSCLDRLLWAAAMAIGATLAIALGLGVGYALAASMGLTT